MKIKLIPVIEVMRWNENVKSPNNGPYWRYPCEYEKYHKQCLAAAGFTPMRPYQLGSGFYELSELSETNLLLQIRDRTEGYEVDEICPFDGGYVLNLDGVDLLYPQCCGDLSDIFNWTNLANLSDSILWQGHPAPIVTIDKESIVFDMIRKNHDEHFVPPLPQEIVTINAQSLFNAMTSTNRELDRFANRLRKINDKYRLGIDRIDELLIFGTYPD